MGVGMVAAVKPEYSFADKAKAFLRGLRNRSPLLEVAATGLKLCDSVPSANGSQKQRTFI